MNMAKHLRSVSTKQAHNVETTSVQRCLKVKTLNKRWNNVYSTCARWAVLNVSLNSAVEYNGKVLTV